MVPLIENSPLGLSRTFRTPLKGDVLSCPANDPNYGTTFCDIVLQCPVLSGNQNEVLKFYIRSEIRQLLLHSVAKKVLSVITCALRPRQILIIEFFSNLTEQCRAEISANYPPFWCVRIREIWIIGFIQCVENFQNMRVAVSVKTKRIGAVKMSQQLVSNGDRLNALGYKLASKRKPLEALDARGKLLVEYQIYGCPHEWIRQYTRLAPVGEDPWRRIPIEPGWPLTLEEAADALRIKRRNARWISRQPVFQRELAEQLQTLRNGMKARAVLAQGEILDDRGDGAAADRKVRLQAAQAILGEDNRDRSVNVTVNNGVQLTAGIVVRLPSHVARTPLEDLVPVLDDFSSISEVRSTEKNESYFD